MVLLVLLLMTSVGMNVCHYKSHSIREPVRDTIRETYVDTIPFYKPVPRDSIVIRYVAEKLPVVKTSTAEPSCPAENVTKNMDEQSCCDSVSVQISITQKVYEDSTYRAYVSGFSPNLDSIFVYPKREIITIKEAVKPKRWSVGIQAGYGMTLKQSPQFVPYIGVGISYSLWQF